MDPITLRASAAQAVEPVRPVSGEVPSLDAGGRPNPFLQLVQQAEQDHRAAFSALQTRMRVMSSATGPSTGDMLRLQSEVAAFGLRVQLTVRIADEIGRGIQTLTQRS